jgi:uracil-DNA glycosylase family 4
MTRQEALDQIAREIRRSRHCPLAGGAGSPVPGEGPADAQIFFVGQSPGLEESRTGRPFVGRAGKFLDQALRRAGLSRRGVFITSVEKHFPPGNRPPTRAEIEACKPALLRQLDVVDPRVVVLLGRIAERALADEPVLEGRRVLVTTHPAAAMRFPWLRRRFLRDLHRLGWLTRCK